MTLFLERIISGINLGSIYAIIALGYTMVYGIARMLNFAHGDVIMIGAYICFVAIGSLSLPPLVGVLLAVAVCTILGVVIERLAYRPLRQSASLAVLITAIGVSYLLQNLAQLIWTADTKSFPPLVQTVIEQAAVTLGLATPEEIAASPNFGSIVISANLRISGTTIVTILANILIMIGLTLFTGHTKTGKAMRAVSEDRGAAELMGISVNRTIALTFAIGSALAAIAGVLLCSTYQALQPTTGSMPGIKAFTAAVFGGIGSIPGAMIGGILLGIIEILGNGYVSTQLGDAFVFAVLIVVLLVKPTGLLGKKVSEKV
ncbi:MAG TPA: branched-chain amino acid ABC transporter permease [Candidatus Pullichristensenella avicola]|nr:branched-chain amino acid ABC transporter permease [Candidatus Pullichristensenella avicola]